jgi:hypothetical protein
MRFPVRSNAAPVGYQWLFVAFTLDDDLHHLAGAVGRLDDGLVFLGDLPYGQAELGRERFEQRRFHHPVQFV